MPEALTRRRALFGLLALPFIARGQHAPQFTPQAVDLMKEVVNRGEVVFLSSEVQPLALDSRGRSLFVVGEPVPSRAELQENAKRIRCLIEGEGAVPSPLPEQGSGVAN